MILKGGTLKGERDWGKINKGVCEGGRVGDPLYQNGISMKINLVVENSYFYCAI